ncbi:hypothetical protein VTO42DRAFT_7886 [Malbranchea cinnamomea]
MSLFAFLVSYAFWLLFFIPKVRAQDDSLILTGTAAIASLSFDDPAPTDESFFQSYESTVTVNATAEETGTGTWTATDSVYTTTSDDVVLIVGSQATSTLTSSANDTTITGNATRTATETAAVPTNTRPCNGYPELCERKYSNITEVAAHNSPFVRQGSIASNQELDVTTQLNDGIRMLQFQTRLHNGTVHLCHSSCELLDAGPLEDYLRTVTEWIKANPYDVVTLLIGNADFALPGNFTAPIRDSGLIDYVYEPPKIPMALDDWPTLSKLILSNKRAVVFMDYMANQTEIPYILDEFSQMWETPFSPTDRNFPCVVQRPPSLRFEDAQNRLYIANHNLNTEINLLGANILVPNTVLLNETNAVSGFGSVGAMAGNCTQIWGRPPNFLLVDYYNIGSSNGSVFQVAAEMNNVTYHGKCCGLKSSATRNIPSTGFASVQYLALIVMTVIISQL